MSQLDYLTLILVATAAFATAVFHSVGGFAGALLLSVCLAPLLGVQTVVPVVALAMVVSNINRIVLFRSDIDWSAWWAIMRTALPGILLGSITYLYLPVSAVAFLLGLFLILSIPMRRYLKRQNQAVSRRGLSSVGVLYGLVSGTVFGAGMILGPFLLGAGIEGAALVGTVAALGMTLNVTKTVVFGFGDLLNSPMISLGLVTGLCTIPGGILGRYIVRNSSLRIHTRWVELMLLLGGCYFLQQGIANMG